MDWFGRKNGSTASRSPNSISSVVLSDIKLPTPRLPIPQGHVPRYLKSSAGVRCVDPPSSRFSVMRIGSNDVPGFQHVTRDPPSPHVFMRRPPCSTSHARLMQSSWPPGYKFPRDTIPYSIQYFGEDENCIGCFTQTLTVDAPELDRKKDPTSRPLTVTPFGAPAITACDAPTPSPRTDSVLLSPRRPNMLLVRPRKRRPRTSNSS
jgi:hypothetical protein